MDDASMSWVPLGELEMNEEKVLKIAKAAGVEADCHVNEHEIQRFAALLRAEFIKEMGEPLKFVSVWDDDYCSWVNREPENKLYKLTEEK
jgi:hypothetical protein